MSMNTPLRWYLTSSAFALIPGGIQAVLFPWLVAIYLHESPARVGVAQMAGQLPMLGLILVGGLLGDRIDQRRLLIRLHSIMLVPPLLMAVLVAAGLLNFGLLIGWALVGGVLGAFAQPARDALLSRVAGHDVQRVVMLATAVQFGVQIIGFGLGSVADRVGPVPLMLGQAAFMAMCVLATTRLPQLAPTPARLHSQPLKEIGEGLAIAWRSPLIRPALILAFAVGLFFAGTYMVVLPLMVRDIYHGGAGGMALSFALNMLGTVCTIFVLMRRGGVARPGRALLLGGAVSSCVLLVLHFPLPVQGFYGVTFIWGMCGGISMTMGRSMVQEAAPASHRARVMSVYSLGMMGGMPIGSVVLGWCVGEFGALDAVLVPVVGMASVLLLVGLTTQLWRAVRAEPLPAAADPAQGVTVPVTSRAIP